MDHDVRRDRRPGALRALVTGGARGLGEAIAARLVRDGAAVALMDISSEVGATAERIAALRRGARVVSVVGDVADEGFVDTVVAGGAGSLGGLDVVVNNAAVGGPVSDLVEISTEEVRRVIEVNLLGTMLVARAAARVMVAQGRGGNIVNIGSIFGQQGVAGGAAYCAAKGGVALLTHSLALELAPYRIRVNTVAPGNMATEMHWADLRSRAEAGGTSVETEAETVRSRIPLGRHGTGDDVAGAVAWVVSGDASYVTGQTIGVNGGVLLT